MSNISTKVSYTWIWATTLVWFIADQLTKLSIVSHMQLGESFSVWGAVLSFTRRINTGGAFGILQGNILLLSIVGCLVLVLLMIFGPGLVGRGRLSLFALGMVAGGAAGNLLDRARLGHVIDFIDVHLTSSYTWPTFNVADIGISIGVALLLYVSIFGKSTDMTDKTISVDEIPDDPPSSTL